MATPPLQEAALNPPRPTGLDPKTCGRSCRSRTYLAYSADVRWAYEHSEPAMLTLAVITILLQAPGDGWVWGLTLLRDPPRGSSQSWPARNRVGRGVERGAG